MGNEKVVLYKIEEKIKSVQNEEEQKEEIEINFTEISTIPSEFLKNIKEYFFEPIKYEKSIKLIKKSIKVGEEENSEIQPEKVMVSDKEGIKIWDIEKISGMPITDLKIGPTNKSKGYPHNKNILYALNSNGNLQGYDLSTPGSTAIYKLEGYDLLDFDHNPNKLYTLATGGKNTALQFWDTRKQMEPPISILTGHTHWITSVEYNKFYDQLIATGSSSTEIFLWRALTQSSHAMEKSGGVSVYTEEDKEKILTQLELDDSVYSVKWSQQEPWVYAGLGFSGQLIVAHVPYEEKYKIMI